MSRSKDTGARDRQAAYRKAKKQARRPDRDDVARVALLWLIKSMEQRSRQIESHASMNMIVRTLVAKLVEQGFDKFQAEDVLEDLVDKYLGGWEFQRKPHLRAPDTG